MGSLADAIKKYVLTGQAIFADDTPVKMLAPGSGKTRTARLWAYVRDERPWTGEAYPAPRGINSRSTGRASGRVNICLTMRASRNAYENS
ncbi:MAG: transposase [Alphaproteobacteria bacterium]|nr:transposase [Alphaproteobacteria bacterium]